MPIYEYKCSSCGHEKEVLQKMSDVPLIECPACGKPALTKLISAAGFQLKGSGWYATDFKGSKSAKAGKGDGSSAGNSAEEGKASKTGDKAEGGNSAKGEDKAKGDGKPREDSKPKEEAKSEKPASAGASLAGQ